MPTPADPSPLAAGGPAGAAPGAPGVVTLPSRHSVAETVDRIEAAVRGRGTTVFARVDHQAGAAAAGLAMHEAVVVLFGSPRAGTPVMTAAPLAALDLPLRVLVWRAPEGTPGAGAVWVSWTPPTLLADRYAVPPALAAHLAAMADGVAAAVAAAASRAGAGLPLVGVTHRLEPDGTHLFEATGDDGGPVAVPVYPWDVEAAELAEPRAEHAGHGEHTPARRLAIAAAIAEPELRARMAGSAVAPAAPPAGSR